MATVDTRPRVSFLPEGAPQAFLIPAESIDIDGGLREVMHEYPHVAGGDPEKMGRKPYTVHIAGNFDGIPLDGTGGGLGAYADFRVWPDNLNELVRYFEDGKTGTLTLPNLPGPIRAYATAWPRAWKAGIISGEKASITFKEHSKRDHLFAATLAGGKTFALDGKIDALLQAIEDQYGKKPVPDIFDAIFDAVNAITEVRDTVGAYDALLAAKVERVTGLFQDADATVQEMQHPENFALFEAFRDLWVAVVDIANDVQGKLITVRTFIVPVKMTVIDVATAIYGDAERTNDILILNEFADAYAIRSGTAVRYYDDSK